MKRSKFEKGFSDSSVVDNKRTNEKQNKLEIITDDVYLFATKIIHRIF